MSLSKKFLLVIVVQIIVITSLVFYIQHKKDDVKGAVMFNPIDRTMLSFSIPSAGLKYYFEPRANTTPKEFNPSWLNREITYHINADRLHERKNYDIGKEEDIYRIVTLGDSFTFGMYVETDENWPNLLENQLDASNCGKFRKIEVLNLGVSGYDLQYSYERFKKRGIKYNPDLVIWMVKDDDFEQLNEIMRQNEKRYIREMKKKRRVSEICERGKAL